MNKIKLISIIVAVVVLVIVAVAILSAVPKKEGKYDAFVQCIANTGTKFYGAFWCSHCQEQKLLFGKSAKLLPYVECSKPSGSGFLPICTDKGISAVPTWEFPNGSKETGVLSLLDLSQKTACQLP